MSTFNGLSNLEPDMPQAITLNREENEEHPMKNHLQRAGRRHRNGRRIGRAGAGCRCRQDSFNKCLCLPRNRRRRQEQGRPGKLMGWTAANPAPRRIIHTRTPTRIPASPGTRPYSRIHHDPKAKIPGTKMAFAVASRTRKRSTISGPTSRNTTRTARPSNAPAVGRNPDPTPSAC